MAKKRRPLIAGVKTAPKLPPDAEAAFVYGQAIETVNVKPTKTPVVKPKRAPAEPATPPVPVFEAEQSPQVTNNSRVPLTTRLRGDIANGLKRASLERQLSREEPNTVQELIEAALEPWLKERGYLP